MYELLYLMDWKTKLANFGSSLAKQPDVMLFLKEHKVPCFSVDNFGVICGVS